MGAQSTYTEALGEEIIERLSEGEPLAAICRDDHMPSDRTVRNWMAADDAFASAIAGARESGFDVLAAQCLAIADDGDGDVTVSEDGRETVNSETVQRAKLRIETRLKLLAKWDPKRYGDRIDANVSMAGGLTINVRRFTPDPEPDAG